MIIIDVIRRRKKQEVINHLPAAFFPHQYIISNDGHTAAAIDQNSCRLCLINSWDQYAFFNSNQILNVQINMTKETYLKRAMSSTLTGYLIGRALDPKNGSAIIGGLYPRLKQNEKIISIHLDLRIADWEYPNFSILTYKGGLFSNLYSAIKLSKHWESIINILQHHSSSNH